MTINSIIFDLTIRNAVILQPDGSTLSGDLACHKGKIEKIATYCANDSKETIEASGNLLLPGVIDPQVHFREPGNIHKEDIASGSRAAVRGGVTSFLEMPNCSPPTVSQKALDWKLSRAAESSVANFGFFIGASKDNLNELSNASPTCGIKIFMGSSTGDLLVDDEVLLEKIFSHGERLIAVHAEDEKRIRHRESLFLSDSGAALGYDIHSQIRDHKTAVLATQRALDLSKKYGRRLHILHLSTADEVDILRREKLPQISCEVVTNHLFLSSEDYLRLGSKVQMNPPVRSPENATVLWDGLKDGIIDIIATDHAPHTAEEKQQPYPLSPSGIPGVETSLPLMLTAMKKGQCTLKDIQLWMSYGPAQLYRIPNKGLIAEGFDADLTLVDIESYHRVMNHEIFSRAGWSPFHNYRLTGWPLYTIVNGQVIFENGNIRTGLYGRSLTFDALPN